MEHEPIVKPLHVINPGFDRNGLSGLESPEPAALYIVENSTGLQPDTWQRLQWWESPLQAQAGIKALCAKPFLHVRKEDEQHGYVPTRFLYPDALQSSQTDRIVLAAQSIAAHVRQAREMYTAAGGAGVTDLSRPLLYYYGAVALAKAATAALFGAEHFDKGHGLGVETGPADKHPDDVAWPVIVSWQSKGTFPALYRAARWDELFKRWDRWGEGLTGISGKPRFHILECIRLLGYEWGVLTQTGFSRPMEVLAGRRSRENCLLLYQHGGSLFMRHDTPLEAPVFQAPNVLVYFMALYYFSMLARYHAATWQDLLGGASEPEGYVFRFAAQQAAHDYVREITRLLPYPEERTLMAPPSWLTSKTLLKDWYRPLVEIVGAPSFYMPVYQPQEWRGEAAPSATNHSADDNTDPPPTESSATS